MRISTKCCLAAIAMSVAVWIAADHWGFIEVEQFAQLLCALLSIGFTLVFTRILVKHISRMITKAAQRNAAQLWIVLVLGAVGFCMWLALQGIVWVLPEDWKIKYALEYNVPFNKVHISNKPTLCDWRRAPIGDKACHYEKAVSTTLSGKSINGEFMVSYDDGKTWFPDSLALDYKNPLTKNIFIDWQRHDDP